MSQYCFARCRLAVVVVCNSHGRSAAARPDAYVAGPSAGGRHCKAGQYGYVPLATPCYFFAVPCHDLNPRPLVLCFEIQRVFTTQPPNPATFSPSSDGAWTICAWRNKDEPVYAIGERAKRVFLFSFGRFCSHPYTPYHNTVIDLNKVSP